MLWLHVGGSDQDKDKELYGSVYLQDKLHN